MPRLPRLAAAVALLAGLAAAARAAEPDKLLPATADTVIAVNVKQLVASEFAKKFVLDGLKKQFESPDTKKFLTDIGLDPLKDVERMVIASIDTKFGEKTDPSFLLILRGSFDPEKIYKAADAAARAPGAKMSMVKDGGTVLFKYQPDGEQPPVYGTVVDGKTVVVASEKKYVSAAVQAADASKPAALKKELAELVKKADDKASIYIATVVSGKLADLGLPDEVPGVKLDKFNKALPNTETALITVKVAADLTLDVYVGMKDEAAANDMRNAANDLIDQLKPLAKLVVGFEPGAKALPDILEAVKITSKNKDMILSLKVAGDDLSSLMQLGEKRKKERDKKDAPKKD